MVENHSCAMKSRRCLSHGCPTEHRCKLKQKSRKGKHAEKIPNLIAPMKRTERAPIAHCKKQSKVLSNLKLMMLVIEWLKYCNEETIEQNKR